MNIRHIAYFVEVAKERNFTKAANNLHLSQPALSKVIKNLELDLGVSLIDRAAKQFKLTDQGEIFFENSKNALNNINEELDQLNCSINCTKGRLVVGIPPVIGTVYFTSIIAKFKKKYPNIDFIVIEEGANSIRDKVKTSELDIGIVILPTKSEGLNVIKMIESENVLIAHKDNKLVNLNKVTVKDLKEENFITLNKRYMLYDTLKRLCRENGFETKIAFESSQWDFVAEMVSLNQGIAILPEPIVHRYKDDNIRRVVLEDVKIPWEIAIILKKDRYISYAMKEFVKICEEESKELNKK